jgi:elongation factor 1-gamma
LETPSGFTLTESNAIAHYIAESGPKATQLLGSDAEERALIQQWVFFAESALQQNVPPLLMPRFGLAAFDEGVEEKNSRELVKW